MFVLRVWDNLRFLWFNTPIAFPLPANRGHTQPEEKICWLLIYSLSYQTMTTDVD